MLKYVFYFLVFGQFLGLIYYHWNYSSQSNQLAALTLQNNQLLQQNLQLQQNHRKYLEIVKNCTIITKNYNEIKEIVASKSSSLSSIISPQTSTTSLTSSSSPITTPQGVVMTLLGDHPTWFQRRYTFMIQNALNNIPKDWVVQIFHHNNQQFLAGMSISGGIRKLLQLYPNRIIFTELPAHVTNERKRPIHIMTHPWVWEKMLSDNVLVFGGNHVICSNSPYRLQDFLRYDYISAPWGRHKGVGGGSGISIRNRKVMLTLIERRLNQTSIDKRDKAYLEWGRDDDFFVDEMIRFNKERQQDVYSLAPKEIVSQFSASGGTLISNQTHFPFSVSDTLPGISFEERGRVIDLCPEMKILFPSLHEPGCFGASLQREKCAASICALNPNKHSC